MTEKRFTTDNGSNEDVCLVDNITGKEYESNFDDIVDLLNDLDDENTQLKKILNISKNDNVRDILDVLNLQQTTIWELNRENEQLKNKLSKIEKKIKSVT